jgi:hypothetical protein
MAAAGAQPTLRYRSGGGEELSDVKKEQLT